MCRIILGIDLREDLHKDESVWLWHVCSLYPRTRSVKTKGRPFIRKFDESGLHHCSWVPCLHRFQCNNFYWKYCEQWLDGLWLHDRLEWHCSSTQWPQPLLSDHINALTLAWLTDSLVQTNKCHASRAVMELLGPLGSTFILNVRMPLLHNHLYPSSRSSLP